MTLPTFPYTQQKAFNIAYKGIIEQGGPSFNVENYQCVYRSPTGRKCAIGHIIPDKKYDPQFEDNTADDVLKILYEISSFDRDFYQSLQRVHDDIMLTDGKIKDKKFLAEFKIKMKVFAEDHSLKLPQHRNQK